MTDPSPPLTREEQSFLIKILWESLQSPSWSKDDLITFGLAIFGKTPLKDLDPKKFDKLFPFLVQITTQLGAKLKEAILPTPAPPSQETTPGTTPPIDEPTPA
jgi:hypothetical protein